jgi:hypothetical protein
LAIGQAIKAGLTTHQFSGVAATCVAGSPFNQAAVRACVAQHAATLGLNDTFLVVLIICVASIMLALIIGHDPAVRAYQEARARGEEVTPEPLSAMSE